MTSMPCNFLFGLGALAALSTPAMAENITMEGIVRSASLYAAIVEFCPRHQHVDIDLATGAAKAMADAVNEALGQGAGRVALGKELDRRFEEARTSGTVQWCADQRRQSVNAPLFLAGKSSR